MSADGVVLPYWPDRPPSETLDVAELADRCGYQELWCGEMATFDAFAIAAAVAVRTKRIAISVGPLAVSVRDPAALALGIGSVSELGERPASLALGVSTPVLASSWHGRAWEHPVARLAETIDALRPMLAGQKSDFKGEHVRSHGFRLRTRLPDARITVAAFGDASIRVAARNGDRMVINLVTAKQAGVLHEKLATAAREAGRAAPPLAAWVTAAVDPTHETLQQIAMAFVPYLGAPGYGQMLTDAGFGDLVARARSGAHPKELLAAIPLELIASISATGDADAVRARIDEYRSAGVDHIGIVPATAGDALARTLTELAQA